MGSKSHVGKMRFSVKIVELNDCQFYIGFGKRDSNTLGKGCLNIVVAFWSNTLYVDGEDQDIDLPDIKVGDTVEAILDSDEGTVSFIINN